MHPRLPDGPAPHLSDLPDGGVQYAVPRSAFRLDLAPGRAEALVRALLDALPDERRGGPLLVAGLGRGELLRAALATGMPVIGWEPDAWVLQRLRRDDAAAGGPLAAAIADGRLRVLLGADLVDPALFDGPGWTGPVLRHPELAAVFADAFAWIGAGPPAGGVALVAQGGLMVAELRGALARRGLRPWPVHPKHSPPAELTRAVEVLRPQLAAQINRAPGFGEACTAAGVPLLTWEIDPQLERRRPPRGPVQLEHLFTWQASRVDEWRRLGSPHVHGLPLGADPQLRRPTPGGDPCPVAFVGSSLTAELPAYKAALIDRLRRHARLSAPAAEAALTGLLDAMRRSPREDRSGPLLEALAPGLAARDPDLDPRLLLAEIAAAERRLRVVAGLGRFGVHAWGDAGWGRLQGHPGVRVRGWALHGDPLNAVYSAAAINVDIGRLYQLDIVPMRVFDVLACGGFLLAEDSPALRALFTPGVHLDVWTDEAHLHAQVARYLADPAARARIAAAGRAELLRAHTVDHRLAQMLALAAPALPGGPD